MVEVSDIVELKVGDVIQEGDYYLSSSGYWEPTPIWGHQVQDNNVRWARKK